MSAPEAAPRRAPGWALAAVVVVILAAHATLALTAAATKSITWDEVLHLTSGVSYWRSHEYGFQPENGNFPQRWGGLPVALSDAPPMDRSARAYRASEVGTYGRAWLCGMPDMGDGSVLRARAAMTLLSVALCLVTFAWSRRLWGDQGALLSLLLLAFDPTLLAHGPLVTSDVTASLAFLLAAGTLWRLLHDVRPRRILAAGASLGLLSIAKFSAVLFGPVALGLIALRAIRPEPLPWAVGGREGAAATVPRRLAAMTAAIAPVIALGWALTWAAYGFRHDAFRADAVAEGATEGQVAFHPRTLDAMLDLHPPLERPLRVARALRLLPEAYVYGMAHALHHSQSRLAFLDGEVRREGWVRFFPMTVLLKTPLSLLAAWAAGLVAAAVLAVRAWRAGRREAIAGTLLAAAPLLLLLAVTWAAALTSHLNIGHRHVLLTYPIACILLGGLMRVPVRPRVRALLAAALVVGLMAETSSVRPHYLAFFNAAAGGPDRGWTRLVDSSLDWGQDLPAIARWIDEHAPPGSDAPPVHLAFFGNACVERVRAHPLVTQAGPHDPVRPLPHPPLGGGWYLVSASMLQVYSRLEMEPAQADAWLAQLAAIQAELLATAEGSPERAAIASRFTPEQWHVLARRAERVVLDRLCARLREREPDAIIAHTVLAYRLSDDEIAAMLAPLPTARAER